jgi:hypothetical protein
MSIATEGLAQRAARWWVSLYTIGLPASIRDRRRAEIRSDLWEQQRAFSREGHSSGLTALVTLDRTARGVPADLVWRVGTGDTAGQSLGLWFAFSATMGLWLAFLRPGVPDLNSSAPALAEFYAGKGLSITVGHVLIWTSAGIFARFVLRLCRSSLTMQHGQGALHAIVLVSGMAAAATLCLVFALTGVASFSGEAGLDPSVTQHLFPLAGLTFHTVLSGAMAVFLAATTAVSVQGGTGSNWTAWFSGVLGFLFLLEATGALLVFLLPQALFLAWVVVKSFEVSGRRLPHVS